MNDAYITWLMYGMQDVSSILAFPCCVWGRSYYFDTHRLCMFVLSGDSEFTFCSLRALASPIWHPWPWTEFAKYPNRYVAQSLWTIPRGHFLSQLFGKLESYSVWVDLVRQQFAFEFGRPRMGDSSKITHRRWHQPQLLGQRSTLRWHHHETKFWSVHEWIPWSPNIVTHMYVIFHETKNGFYVLDARPNSWLGEKQSQTPPDKNPMHVLRIKFLLTEYQEQTLMPFEA